MNYNKYQGSTSHCAQHWLHQRLTALLMLPLVLWLLIFTKRLAHKSPVAIIDMVKEPVNFLMIILLTMFIFYHATLGLRTVIEDYVSNLAIRNVLIVLVQCFSLITMVSSIVSIVLLSINY